MPGIFDRFKENLPVGRSDFSRLHDISANFVINGVHMATNMMKVRLNSFHPGTTCTREGRFSFKPSVCVPVSFGEGSIRLTAELRKHRATKPFFERDIIVFRSCMYFSSSCIRHYTRLNRHAEK